MLVGGCWLLFVDCLKLNRGSWFSFVGCCFLSVLCIVLIVAFCLFECWMLNVGCCVFCFVVCCVLFGFLLLRV